MTTYFDTHDSALDRAGLTLRVRRIVVNIIRGHELTTLVLGLACWVEAGAASPDLLGDDRMGKRLLTLAPALLNRVELAAKRRARHVGRRSCSTGEGAPPY